MRQKDEVISSFSGEVSKLYDNLRAAEHELGRQQHYSRRNCLLLHGNEEIKHKNLNDLAIHTLNTELNLDLTIKDLDRFPQIRICDMHSSALSNLTLKI